MGRLPLELYDFGPFVKDFAMGITWKNRNGNGRVERVIKREEKIEGGGGKIL